MANKKITDLVDIGTPASGDLLEIVDISEGVSKRVAVSALGGGSTPTLQDVRDENPNVSVENPNDANNVGLWNSLQYNEDALRVEDRLLIEALSGDVQQITSRFSDSASIQIQGSIYDSVTEDSLVSFLGVEQGKAFVLEIINDSTLNQGSHKIELDPAIGEEVIFKTPNDATTGTETIATREWVNSNLPTIDATPTDGSSNAVSSNGVFDALALKVPNAIRVGYTSLTGVTGANVLASILIPANWLNDGESFKVEITNFKSVTAGSVNFAMYHDTVLNGVSNTISNGQQLTSLFRVGGVFYRLMTIDGTTLYNSVSSNAVQQVPAASTAAANTTTFDRTVNNYITVTSNPSVISEVTGFYYLSVTKI